MHMLLNSPAHTRRIELARLRDESRGRDEGALWKCMFLSHWHSNLRGTQPRRLNGRKPKKKKEWHGRLLSWQMMFHLRGFIEPRLPFRFISSLFSAEWPKGLSVSSDESQNAGNGPLFVSDVDKCGVWSQGHAGKCSAVEFIAQSVLEINQAYSIYRASQCQDPRKGIKCTFF